MARPRAGTAAAGATEVRAARVRAAMSTVILVAAVVVGPGAVRADGAGEGADEGTDAAARAALFDAPGAAEVSRRPRADPRAARALAACPADAFAGERPFWRGLASPQPPSERTYARHPADCYDLCLTWANGPACFDLALAYEHHGLDAPDRLDKERLYALAGAMGFPAGCTDRAAGIRNGGYGGDPFEGAPPADRQAREHRGLRLDCDRRGAWGCAMLGPVLPRRRRRAGPGAADAGGVRGVLRDRAGVRRLRLRPRPPPGHGRAAPGRGGRPGRLTRPPQTRAPAPRRGRATRVAAGARGASTAAQGILKPLRPKLAHRPSHAGPEADPTMRTRPRRSFAVEVRSGGRRGATVIPHRPTQDDRPGDRQVGRKGDRNGDRRDAAPAPYRDVFEAPRPDAAPPPEARRILPSLVAAPEPEPVAEAPPRRRGRPPTARPEPDAPPRAAEGPAEGVPTAFPRAEGPSVADEGPAAEVPAAPAARGRADAPRPPRRSPAHQPLPLGERWKRRLGRWAR